MQAQLTTSTKRLWGFAWIAALLVMAFPALAIAPKVQDGGKFFSESTLEQANDQIRKIKDQFGKDLVIETYEKPPAGKTAPADEAGKKAFFTKWVEQRGEETDTDGIFILICKSPAYIHVASGKNTGLREFRNHDSAELAKSLLQAFREKPSNPAAKPRDQALMNAISTVRSTLQANGASSTPHSVPSGGSVPHNNSNNSSSRAPISNSSNHTCLWAILIIVGIFIVIRVVSHMAGGGQGNMGGGGGGMGGYSGGQQFSGGGYQTGYGGGGGGGFMRGMLGGILGGAAGSWLYDRFSNHNEASGGGFQQGGGYQGGPGGYNQGSTDTDQSQQSDQGQGFDQGSGGSFDSGSSSDSGSSGSDSGSSDSSSSFDSGGGGFDSGSSGGDSGGGGGDF